MVLKLRCPWNEKFRKLLESYKFIVKLFDEGTSTRRAMGQMFNLESILGNQKVKKDEVAAATILQDYFDFMRSTSKLVIEVVKKLCKFLVNLLE